MPGRLKRIDAATLTYPLSEPFPLLGGHVLPAVGHSIGYAIGYATAHIGTVGAVASESAEKDTAQHQNSEGLPEGNRSETEEWRQQPIPQGHHDLAADVSKKYHRQNSQRNHPNQILSFHSQVLIRSS